MSKGSKPRPFSVSDEVFSNNFDSIFPRDSTKRETAYVVFPAMDLSSIDQYKSDECLNKMVQNEVSKIELHEQELGAKVSRIIGETIGNAVIADYESRLKLKGAGYESCKETDTPRAEAAKNRA